jgi:hypothetical protein
MNVYLTFDIEIWCNGWNDLDRAFPSAFERYIYGHSREDGYALPKTLEILCRHGLQGVFFVETLFAARFGLDPLRRIVSLIRNADQEVQLHLHPEWTNESRQPLIENCQHKRQHLCQYTREEQTLLIGHGRRMLQEAGSGPVTAFRAGSYAANRDTFAALASNQIWVDSSLNRCGSVSGIDLRKHETPFQAPFRVEGVSTLPVTVFLDGFGRDRPAQVGACGSAELQQALHSARANGCMHFVIVSHNFEMLRSGSTKPDMIVARRFEQLCAFLEAHRAQFQVRGLSEPVSVDEPCPKGNRSDAARAGWLSTSQRHFEQLRRRMAI